MVKLAVDPDRVLAELDELARIGGDGRAVHRPALSPGDVAARLWLEERMAAAGLETRIDGVGNVFGRTPGARRRLLLGSHTDTVPGGGRLDGALGVLYGLEIARAFMAAGGGDPGLEVIDFSDEEGTFRPLLGSRSYADSLDEGSGVRSADGRSLQEALDATPWCGRPPERLDPQAHLGYLEAHIEQGPTLEASGCDVGVVDAICGLARLRVVFSGRADHAGTTPPELRRDAGSAALTLAAEVPDLGATHDAALWNVGGVDLEPGMYNVVPARAVVLIEYRGHRPDCLESVAAATGRRAHELAEASGLTVEVERGAIAAPARLDEDFGRALESAARQTDASARRMVSGAGHDAMAIAPHLPAGLLFVPSVGGRSHDPDEDTRPEDIVRGLKVLTRAVEIILADSRAGSGANSTAG